MSEDFGFELSQDEMFAPLMRHIERARLDETQRQHVLGNYMYMGFSSVNGETKPNIYAYKHSWTREYVHIGKDTGELMKGKLDTSRRGYINEPQAPKGWDVIEGGMNQ